MKTAFMHSAEIFTVALISAMTLFFSGCATQKTAYSDPNATAVVQEVSGAAEISTDGSSWGKAAPGTAIPAGSRIRTSPNGMVTLNLGNNGGSVDVMPGSLLEIERLGATTSEPDVLAVLNLREGRAVGDTKNPPSHGKVIIRTPKGTYEVR